mmetsp:Transcript_22168/g.44476  ORF Transcript_22168/g.44476 Transcript_22168/m.44476 type:complete len:99 (-) Transcript_22168:335-631(-)
MGLCLEFEFFAQIITLSPEASHLLVDRCNRQCSARLGTPPEKTVTISLVWFCGALWGFAAVGAMKNASRWLSHMVLFLLYLTVMHQHHVGSMPSQPST